MPLLLTPHRTRNLLSAHVLIAVALAPFAFSCSSTSTGADPNDAAPKTNAEPEDDPSAPNEDKADDEAPSKSPRCAKSAPFGAPTKLDELADIHGGDPWVSTDGNTLVFTSTAPKAKTPLRFTERTSPDGTFGSPEELPLADPKGNEYEPSLSPDKKTLYFIRGSKILKATRTSTTEAFGNAEELDLDLPMGSTASGRPYPAGDTLYFAVRGSNKRWSVYKRSDGVTTPVFVDAGRIGGLAVTSDEKTIYITLEGNSGWEVYRGERESKDLLFSEPELVVELEAPPSTQGFAVTSVTDDDCELYGYVLSLEGEMRVYRATRGK